MVDGSSLMSLNDILRDESVREKVILENIRHRKGWQDFFAGGEFWFFNYLYFSHRWLRRQNCSTQTPSSPSICTNTLLGVSTTIQFTKTQLIWKKKYRPAEYFFNWRHRHCDHSCSADVDIGRRLIQWWDYTWQLEIIKKLFKLWQYHSIPFADIGLPSLGGSGYGAYGGFTSSYLCSDTHTDLDPDNHSNHDHGSDPDTLTMAMGWPWQWPKGQQGGNYFLRVLWWVRPREQDELWGDRG